MNSLTFLYIIYFLSIILLICGVLQNIVYLLPLQIKQARVRNGLASLRRLMLMQGFLNLIVGLVAIASLTSRFFISGDLARYVTVLLVLAFSLGFFTFTTIWVLMYKQQFTNTQKRLHDKIAAQEAKLK